MPVREGSRLQEARQERGSRIAFKRSGVDQA